jgi:hypothetical protein
MTFKFTFRVDPVGMTLPYAAADSYDNKDVALKLGARYGSAGWYAPPGVDLSAFGERGWL